MEFNQQKSEYDSKLIDLRRVTRVTKGGKRFNFRATVVLGDHKGKIGVGVGKGADTSIALEKATRAARKKMFKISLNEHGSIARAVTGKWSGVRIMIKPNSRKGRGLVAGGAVRTVLSYAGVKNTSAKIISASKNKINNARAAIEALKKIQNTKVNPVKNTNLAK